MTEWLQRYLSLRASTNWPHVHLTLYVEEELDSAAKGYSGPGWQNHWVVIGHDQVGDPIVVDTPGVFTLMHGLGVWDEPILIAKSVDVLMESMDIGENVLVGRETLASGLEKVAELNVGESVDLEFWAITLGDY